MAERPNPDPDPNPILSINDNRLVRLGSLTPLTSLAAWTIVKRPLAVPQLGSCASSGRAWRLRATRHSLPRSAGLAH